MMTAETRERKYLESHLITLLHRVKTVDYGGARQVILEFGYDGEEQTFLKLVEKYQEFLERMHDT